MVRRTHTHSDAPQLSRLSRTPAPLQLDGMFIRTICLLPGSFLLVSYPWSKQGCRDGPDHRQRRGHRCQEILRRHHVQHMTSGDGCIPEHSRRHDAQNMSAGISHSEVQLGSTRVGHPGESGENTGGTTTGSYCRNLIRIPLAYFRGTGEDVGCGKVGRGKGEETVSHQSNNLGSRSLYQLGPAIKASGWRRVQPGHSHMNGFTVLWICLCCLRPEDVAKVLPQSGQAWARAPTCCERM